MNILEILEQLPPYYGFWRTDYGDWAFGEIGGTNVGQFVQSNTLVVGTLEACMFFAIEYFKRKKLTKK
jgi:hypothetical protein